MNNETLKRDLASRMFEGVKVTDEDALLNPIAREVIGIDGNKIIMRQTRFPYRTFGNFKDNLPYLFPTSALTKEIQIANYNNGEPFVPIVECLKSLIPESYTYSIRKNNTTLGATNIKGHILLFNNDFFILKYRTRIIPFNQVCVCDLLHKFHINYRLSPDQFIEVTEENNPYK